MQYNPRTMQSIVPTPLVSVGQLQQGINQQKENLFDIGRGLDTLARTKSESKINDLLAKPGLDYTDASAVRNRLGGLLDYTTKESRQSVLDRISEAGKQEKRKSDISLADSQKENIASTIKERNTMLPVRVANTRANTANTLFNTEKGKKTLPLDLKRLEANIENTLFNTQRGRELLPFEKSRAGRENEGLSLGNMIKYNDMKYKQEDRDALKNKPVQSETMKAAQDNISDTVKKGGLSPVIQSALNKTLQGFNENSNSWLDAEITDKDKPRIEAAVIEMLRDPKYAELFNTGTPQGIYQAVTDYLRSKGTQMREEYDPDLLSPSTWLTRRLKAF